MRVFTSFSCAVALTLALAPGVRADENDRLTYMTFSGPVQVPGVTLAAGTYTFKLADLQGSRHVVQIFNKDDMKLITTVMTIPNDRLEPVKDTFVMFSERPAGTPVAVKAWFYPGRSIGEEFLYPKQQATQIAKKVHQPVLTTEGNEVSAGATARVNEAGTVTREKESASASTTTTSSSSTTTAGATTTSKKAPAPAATTARANPSTTAQVGTAGQARTASQAPPAPATTAGRRSLPRTASPIALFELLSGLSLAGAVGLRRLRIHR